MNTDRDPELERLSQFDEIIQRIAGEFGLEFFPQEFDIIPAQKMLEIMAYHFPVNFSSWSFGRDYEMEKTKYEHGYSIPYEVVLNSNPSRAYLINTTPFAVQVMVMVHVYGHNDFMKNNFHFKPTRRDILPSASEAATRFQHYEQRYGLEAAERVMDAGLSIQLNVNPDFFINEETEEEKWERLSSPRASAETPGSYDDLLYGKATPPPGNEYKRRTPVEPWNKFTTSGTVRSTWRPLSMKRKPFSPMMVPDPESSVQLLLMTSRNCDHNPVRLISQQAPYMIRLLSPLTSSIL